MEFASLDDSRHYETAKAAAADDDHPREGELGAREITVVSAADLYGRPVPPRCFHVPGILPARTVTLLTGDGGTGTSLLALQLSAATCLDKPWIGLKAERGRVLYLSAEDELDELHRRLADIVADVGSDLSELADLRLVALAGEDAVLAAPNGRSGVIAATPLWVAIDAEVRRWRPTLIVCDTLADLFGGDENHRAQARQFVGMLRGLAIRHDATVLLLAHPSLSGISSGSGASGSTGWSNSVRSRLYLKRATVRDEGSRTELEPDPNVRVLTTMKSNYGPTGGEIRLRWQAGAFRAEGNQQPGAFSQLALTARADAVFLDLVARYVAEGRHVSATPSANFAPTIFAKDPRASGIGHAALRMAMNRAFDSRRIVVEEFGSPSRRLKRIVPVARGGGDD